MKIKITEPCLISGKEAHLDSIQDLNDKDAKSLVLMKKAVYVEKQEVEKGGLKTTNTGSIVEGSKKKGKK